MPFTLVYLFSADLSQQTFLWCHVDTYFTYHFHQCFHVPTGPLIVTNTVSITLLNGAAVQLFMKYKDLVTSTDSQCTPKEVRQNFEKDLDIFRHFGISSIQYYEDIIDCLIDRCDDVSAGSVRIMNAKIQQPKLIDAKSKKGQLRKIVCPATVNRKNVVQDVLCDPAKVNHKNIIQDVLCDDKKCGFMFLEAVDFHFIGADRQPCQLSDIDTFVEIADRILDSGVPNYKGVRIPLVTGLNVHKWEYYVQQYQYPFQKIKEYIKFGFPLSLTDSRNTLHNWEVKNHHSALQFPEGITKFITKELGHQAILGPFKNPPHPQYHCSPLLSRPKNDGNRRVILNLSYPKGQSLNDHVSPDRYDGCEYKLKFPSIDDIADRIRQCTNPRIGKVDIARAFRQLPIDPADALKLGFQWEGAYFLDKQCAFGFLHGSGLFQLCSDLIAFIVRCHGYSIFPYLDDYVLVGEDGSVQKGFDLLLEILDDLGLRVNPDKVVRPTKRITCLGITIDIDQNTLSINQDKILEIKDTVKEVMNKKVLTKGKFESLTGKLLYIHKCVRPARIFINRTLSLLRTNHGRKRITLNDDFHRDMHWFDVFLEKFNGTTIMHKDNKVTHEVHVDACLSGMGGIWNDQVYATPIIDFYGFQATIVHYEMLNIIIALRVWSKSWNHSRVRIYCDNGAVVHVVRSGKTKDSLLALFIRNIWVICATYDIDLDIQHIYGKKNINADRLSRLYSSRGIDSTWYSWAKARFIWHRIGGSHFKLDLFL